MKYICRYVKSEIRMFEIRNNVRIFKIPMTKTVVLDI